MAEWHYLDRNRASVGPVGEDEIQRLLASGDLSANSLVWRADLGGEWRQLFETPLRAGLKPPPAPPAGVPSKGSVTSAPIPVTVPAVGKFFKVVAWIIIIPIAATLLFIISEMLSDTEYYASSVGMSISECREVSMKFGMNYGEADSRCSKRIPKKGR